jgi:hypothetical protein
MIRELWTKLLESLGLANNEDTSDFQDGVEPFNNDIKRPMQEVKETQSDKEALNLFVGKFIKDRSITCEVVACTEDDFRVMILKIEWDRLGTYLDIGQTYPLRQTYQSQNGEMTVWEIDPENMKRDTSQVLLAWEKGIGWSWDLDM